MFHYTFFGRFSHTNSMLFFPSVFFCAYEDIFIDAIRRKLSSCSRELSVRPFLPRPMRTNFIITFSGCRRRVEMCARLDFILEGRVSR